MKLKILIIFLVFDKIPNRNFAELNSCDSAKQKFGSACENGFCIPQSFSYQCRCDSGFWGQRCSFPNAFDPCSNHKCENGGICEPDDRISTNYSCFCAPGFEGTHCEVNQRELQCRLAYCLDHGNGTFRPDGTCHCDCIGAWGGPRCNIRLPCADGPCRVGGNCVNLGLNSYKCICYDWYQGQNCTIFKADPVKWPQNPCQNRNPCRNGGICLVREKSDPSGSKSLKTVCACSNPFFGEFCEKTPGNADPCQLTDVEKKCSQNVSCMLHMPLPPGFKTLQR